MKKRLQFATGKGFLGVAIGVAFWGTSGQPASARTVAKIKSANKTKPLATVESSRTKPELVIQKGTGGFTQAVALSPNGKAVATGDFNGAIRIWDSTTGDLIRLIENHQNNLRRLDFSADGKTLFSSDIRGQVLSWNLTTGTSQVVVNINAIRKPSFAPDQKTIVINSRDKLQFFDRSGKLIRSLPALNSNADIAISPDGSEILAGWGEKLQLVDAQTGSVKREFMSESLSSQLKNAVG